MKTQVVAFDVCRHYLTDYAAEIPSAALSKLHGWLRARSVVHLADATRLLDVVEGSLNPPHLRKHLMQIEAFFKKNASLSASSDTEQAALSSFISSERTCEETNARIDGYVQQGSPDLDFLIERASRYCTMVLGSYDEFLDRLPSLLRLTAGATSTRPRAKSMPHRKVGNTIACTPGCVPYLRTAARYFGYEVDVGHCPWNRVTTVPKNWKTDRTIACEPEGNLPFQLAFDAFVKTRLRRVGIDLSDQSRNQELARIGSIDGSLATIDLASASDTVSINCAALLLPDRWFRYLMDVRSPFYKWDGHLRRYHKLSSMGNGATFAVETLIFAAACYAVGSKSFSVYGDDIVLESENANDLITLLAFLGFSVNEAKSCVTGTYRESCGSHYENGVLITPFYLRTSGSSKSDLCHIVNGLMTVSTCEGALQLYLARIIKDARLPFVPFSAVSTDGVWVDTVTAYKMRLLMNRHGRLSYKRYQAQTSNIVCVGSRARFLWYLQKHRVPDVPHESSRFSYATSKFVRKWGVYDPVDPRLAPTAIYCWSDFIARIFPVMKPRT